MNRRLITIESADDRNRAALRELLMLGDLHSAPLRQATDDIHANLNSNYRDLHEMLGILLRLNENALSTLRVDRSICPLHLNDYAICFEDDEAECAVIRRCWPGHDD